MLVDVTCSLFDTSLARESYVFSSVTTVVGSSSEYSKVRVRVRNLETGNGNIEQGKQNKV